MQKTREEESVGLKAMAKHLLKRFFKRTGLKPKQIVVYRDGISIGQFKRVMDLELNQIRQACYALESDYNPGITYVVVQKRHRTRMYPKDPRQNTDRSTNCVPGFIIDKGVANPLFNDFYLMSHSGIQGTSRPSHYHVLHDENSFIADQIQELTYSVITI